MIKERISDKQGISLIILFIVGTSSIIVTGLEAKEDLWLATILAVAAAVIMAIIYARINIIFPEKDLFEIFEICFGKFIGKILGGLYAWFALFLASLVLRDFGEFYFLVAGRRTPMIVSMIFVGLLGIWVVKTGIEVLGRFGEYFVIFNVCFIVIIIFLLIPNMDVNNIRPTLYEGIKPVIKGAFSAFAFPFGEIVIFTMIFSAASTIKTKSIYKVYICGLLISGVIILLTSTANILVLGVNIASSQYFPSYAAVSRIYIGDFIQRIEILIAITFLIGGFAKMSTCFLAASIGITKVFGFKDYRFIVTPLGSLLIIISYTIHDSIMDFIEWTMKIWPYYVFPLQVVVPIVLLITAEIKGRKL